MIRDLRLGIRAVLLALFFAAQAFAQAPVTYHVSFPEAERHRMNVEVTFPDVPAGPLEVVMSSTSPGRYAIHEFAKNVSDIHIDDSAGAPLKIERPSPSQWNVAGHSGAVRVRYKVFGDRLDGTFLAIDATHAHLNIPASFMWARGLEHRPVRVTFDAPRDWKVATQLRPTNDPRTFTAANLQYLVDSPIELSNFSLRTFNVDGEFRIAVHHNGSNADVDRFASAVEKIVREERAIFGEFPAFEVPYTFIADYLPAASEDGMEHRNSTVLTAPHGMGRPDEQLALLSTAAHEFFHSWNVERIRPASLEPFKLDAPNPSGELWFAEGVTYYYEPLVMRRAGLWSIEEFAGRIGYALDNIIRSPARKYRSAEDMSRLAQFVDGSAWTNPAAFPDHFVSYYDWGAVIGLGLDLMLRVRSDHQVTLDHFMRRLWQEFGRVPPPVDGAVARPVHDPGSPYGARRRVRRCSVHGRVLHPVYSRTRGPRFCAVACARGTHSEKAEPRPRMDRTRVTRIDGHRGTCGSADTRRYARAPRWARSRRRDPVGGWHCDERLDAARADRAPPPAWRHHPHVDSPRR